MKGFLIYFVMGFLEKWLSILILILILILIFWG
jgi:hypothetical protein